MFLALLAGCSPEDPVPQPVTASEPALPPVLDQPTWFEQLLGARPELMTQPTTRGVFDPAWQALVIRPKYRDELLSTPTSTYGTIVAREYSDEERALDARWAESLRDAQRAFSPNGRIRAANYPLEAYTGYRVGDRPLRDASGYTWKVFFELDEVSSLSSESYLGFVASLSEAGFDGDSKIDLRPGSVRFQYNNVIVHAGTMKMAACAEYVGLRTLGRILHVGRGVNVVDPSGALDWHHFLLTGRYDRLPADIQGFVEYHTSSTELDCRG